MDNPADTSENSEEISVPTIEGKNGGRLLAGGKRGNKGGPGRPPDVIRAKLRKQFYRNLAKLQSFAEDTDPAVAMKALEMQAKYGLGTPTAAVDGQGNQTDLPAIQYVEK